MRALQQQTYGFTYDLQGRLTGSNHYSGTSTSAQNGYTERGITYDKNGNILTLQRYVAALQDNYTYTYNGNKLASISGTNNGTAISDATYSYDNNGNTTTDGLKNLQITYNILNLPQSVTQSGTTKATYGWFADGSKYSVQDAQGNGYYYIGSLIYSSTAGTTALESTDFSGGRIVLSGNTQTIHYHHKDHLGSIRAVTDTNGTVIEQNAYYPFGGRHTFGQTYTQTSANRYKFNGKEQQTIGNLDLLDYGARMYDTKTARWLVQDPLAEKYYPFSPYNYCVNNPVMFVDPDGRKIIIGNSKDITTIPQNGTEYEKQVYNDLIKLINLDSEIASVIKDLADSRHEIRIYSTDEKPMDENGKKNEGNAFIPFDSRKKKYNPERGVHTGGTIYYNPNNEATNQGEIRSPFIGLAHEIGHAYNAIKGERVVYEQGKAEKGSSKKDVELGNMNEKRSIYLENIVRKKTNHKERSYEYYKIK